MRNSTNVITDGTLDRRSVLATMGGVGATALAGCGGDGGSDGDDGETDTVTSSGESSSVMEPPEGEPVTTSFDMIYKNGWNANEANLNRFAISVKAPWFMNRIYGQRILNKNLQGTEIKHLVDDYEVLNDGKSLEVTFKEGYTFWDGSDVTASDIYLVDEIGNLRSEGRRFGPENKANDEIISEKDPITIRYNQDCGLSENNLTDLIDRVNVFSQREHLMDYIERFQDAADQSARDEIDAELQNWTWDLETVTEESMGCGLWKPVNWNAERVVHEKYSDHPRADKTNIEEFVFRPINDQQRIRQEWQNGERDIVSGSSISGVQDPPGKELVHKVPTGAQLNWRLNQANPHLAKLNVRRALSYALNTNEIAFALENGNDTPAIPIEYNDLCNPGIRESTYGDDWAEENLIDYGKDGKLEKAAQLLEEEGYSRNSSGVWEHPDDGPLRFENITNTWGPHQFVSDLLSGRLGEFGIEIEVSVLSFSGFNAAWQESYDYDIATWFQQGSDSSQWWGVTNYKQGSEWAFLTDLIEDDYEGPACPSLEDYETPPLTSDVYPRMQMPIKMEFPAEYGNDDKALSGETRKLKPFKYEEILKRGSQEQINKVCKDYAWAGNFHRPYIGLFNEVFTNHGNSEEFIFPAEGTDLYFTRDPWMWMDNGYVQAKTE